MSVRYIQDLYSNSGDNVISASHFGVNFIAGYNQTLPEGNFENIVQDLGVGHIRYPGGTVTETYFDPHGSVWRDLFENEDEYSIAADGRLIEGPGRVFDFATRNDLEVNFVLPTDSLVEMVNGEPVVDEVAVEKVQQLVSDILDGRYGEVRISSFEIGNEYYHHPDMTAEEYAAVANDIIIAVDDAIQNHVIQANPSEEWTAPDISVQAGVGWQDGDNEAIIDGLSTDALEAVTSVVAHYYSSDLSVVEARDQHLGQIDEWEDATGIDNLNYHISEWNVSGTDTGMAQCSTMLSAFDEMLAQGVDTSTIWGAQLRWLNSGLSVNLGGDDLEATDSRLSVGGEMAASMAESLSGLSSIEANPDNFLEVTSGHNRVVSYESGDYLVNVYGDADQAVIYISSRSESMLNLNLDLDAYFGDYNHVWGETLISRDDPITGWRDESDPQSAYGVAEFDGVTTYQINGILPFILEPYEIVRLSVQLSDEGVEMEDHDPLITTDGIDYDDNLVGSRFGDTIIAHIGEDSLVGRDGDDILRGGDDDDGVFGGEGDDAVFGDDGDDFVRGDSGNDWVVGGAGNDRLVGNSGNDIISGNSGNDIIFGGEGDDVISGGSGTNNVSGGSGSDYFIVTSGEHLIVEDYDAAEGDQITFLGQFENAEHLAEHMSTTDSAEGISGDLIVAAPDGSRTVFVGSGDDQDAILGSVVDFTEQGQASLALADELNFMDPNEIGTYVDSLDTEAFNGIFEATDSVILFANLQPEVAAKLLNAFDPEELDTFLEEMGEEGLTLALGEMTEEELFAFLEGVNHDVASDLVAGMGEEVISAAILGMDIIHQNVVQEKFLPSEPEEERNLSGNGSSDNDEPTISEPIAIEPDIIIPTIDRTPESAQEQTEEDEDEEGYTSADCFVATVAYENGEHPDVWLLRWYRDTIMRQSLVGRGAIILYWHLGPKLAEWISNKPKTKRFIQQAIRKIVMVISSAYDRPTGRQIDQPNLSDSRKILLRKAK